MRVAEIRIGRAIARGRSADDAALADFLADLTVEEAAFVDARRFFERVEAGDHRAAPRA